MRTLVAVLAILLITLPSADRRLEAQARTSRQQTPDRSGSAGRASTIDMEVLRLQVMLDRSGFSPGAIDGRLGRYTTAALAAYRQGGRSDAAVEPLTTYTITAEDVAGPFVPEIPRDLVQQASLPSLGYTSVLEALAERFHATPALLQDLNPGATFAAGERIQVPNVEPLVPTVDKPDVFVDAQAVKRSQAGTAAGTSGRTSTTPVGRAAAIGARPDVTVTVSRSQSTLTVRDAAGQLRLFAPVTTGSERDPLPIGEWKVNGIQFNPTFNYNPDLFWDADATHSKARIPPGPNNPVGLVWIDLTKEHYGIHGTPEPASIGRSESHGCVRLTNWDAVKLAGMVKPGTKVVFEE